MKLLSSCSLCNIIRGYLLVATGIIVLLPTFAKQHDLTIPVTPFQVSIFLMLVGLTLFMKRVYDTYVVKNLDQDS